MNKSVDHVHAMLARCLEKDKTFRKHMDTVDRDESGSLSSKEWRILLAKLKKKDHASDSWELTSDIVKLTFKLVLASTGSNDDELTYAGLQAWVVAETKAKGDYSALSADISSWGRNERNSSVVVHPQVKAPAPTTINEMKDAVTKMYQKYAPEKLSNVSFVDHFIDQFVEQHVFAEYQYFMKLFPNQRKRENFQYVLPKEKLWSELCQFIEQKYDCNLNDFKYTAARPISMGTLICPNTSTAIKPDEIAMTRETKQDQGEPSRRVHVCLVGLKAQELNGRMGWTTTEIIKEGEGKGRYHVIFDGKDALKEGNFWPMNCIEAKQHPGGFYGGFVDGQYYYDGNNYWLYMSKVVYTYDAEIKLNSIKQNSFKKCSSEYKYGIFSEKRAIMYLDIEKSQGTEAALTAVTTGAALAAWNNNNHRDKDLYDDCFCDLIIEIGLHILCLPCYICNAMCSGDGDGGGE